MVVFHLSQTKSQLSLVMALGHFVLCWPPCAPPFPACHPPNSLGRLIPPLAPSIKPWPFQDGSLSLSMMAGASRHTPLVLYGLVGFCRLFCCPTITHTHTPYTSNTFHQTNDYCITLKFCSLNKFMVNLITRCVVLPLLLCS